MNDKFYALPKEKQDRILNAGFKVFSQNSYKKSPMNEYEGKVDVDKVVKDYRKIIDFWKKLYLK